MEPTGDTIKKINPLFPFIAVGSLVYAFFYTLLLYQNHSGITYPFWVGGTCFFFFCYLKKCGLTAKKFSVFLLIALLLLGISTCMTDSRILQFFNKTGIFCLFFYMVLHCLYEDKQWDFGHFFCNICTVIFTCFRYLSAPFSEFALYCKAKQLAANKEEGKGKYIFWGILIALPLLFIVLLLLRSADAVFGNLVDRLFSLPTDSVWGKHAVKIGALFLFAFFSSFCLLYRFSDKNLKEEISDKRTAEPVIAITFTGILSFVYAVFCMIQIIYLFAGLGTLPSNYTYASYAREGFFQLVFVCIINLVMVLLCKKYFRENCALKVILTFICCCTYLMIFSSAYRMILYIKVYQLTFLRVFVLWALFVIFLLVTGALAAVYQEKFPLVRYYVITVTVLYIIFSFSHPDYRVAKYNLDHSFIANHNNKQEVIAYTLAENRDLYYLTNLSLDSAPAVFEKLEEMEKNINLDLYDDLSYDYWNWYKLYAERMQRENFDMSFRTFNFSKWIAYRKYTYFYDLHPSFTLSLSSPAAD